jgi:serine/threonine protein kinase
VAVKLVKAGMDSAQVIARFEAERQALALMDHPNIARVLDAGTTSAGRPYFVMDLVKGVPVTRYCDEHRLTPRQRLELFVPVCQAIQHAHQKGIIHRDIKPVNVLMDSNRRPILSDFGIAKVLAAGGNGLTRPGAGVGTPEYMSPEQCRGGEVDGRADIYALGVMLYEVLTGRTPFVGDNYPALAHSHLYNPPPDPALFNPNISPAVRQVILTALQKDPDRRYQRANEMALALEQAVHPSTIGMLSDIAEQPTQRPAGIERLPTTPLYACSNCQRPNKPDNIYCVYCRSLMNFCPRCHHRNRAKDNFCTQCRLQLR